ncbi:MAG: hypothetical protein COA62_03565 [Rhodobiaceae bacterium]|nr:MAG: hypothetical protein COA62_03565 [Rhodobiaceae bacterium]
MVPELELSTFDVANLEGDASPEARAAIGAKVAARFGNVLITSREREIAREILAYLVQDAAELVRASLARSLCQLPGAPKDIIISLASDIDEVAQPVLEASPVLEDEDLLAIVRKGSASKQTAIAGRSTVSAVVSDALVASENRSVVARLVRNDGAIFRDETLIKVADRYGDDDLVAESLVRREDLPVTVIERLVSAVSDELRNYLVERHKMTPEVASQLMRESRERATVDLVDGVEGDDIPKLIRQLSKSGRLTPSLILRAVCMGEMRFFEAAMAELADIPEAKCRSLIHDEGSLGLKALFVRSRLPQVLLPAFRAAVGIYKEMEYTGADNDRQHFRLLMLERLLTSYDELEGDDLDFLLARMSRLSDLEHDGKPALAG